MAIIKSFSSFQNLSNFTTFVNDTNPNSDFFRITEFKETFTGGKNGFLIEGSEFLKETTEVKIEILDVEGNPIYYEPGKGSPDYYEGLSTLVSVHIYPDTPIGIGKITVLGELKQYIDSNGTLRDVPDEWKGVYNVKWERTFKINRNLSNEDIVRFYRRPTIFISELVKPIFSKTVPSITQSGSLEGIAIQPSLGSDLTNWRAGTIYKLKITDGSNWTSSVDENIISVPSLGYSPVVKEVLNNKEVLVDIPYSVNNIVQNFSETPYTTSFEYLEGQTFEESALIGSFARINISNLKTFVGDVARVKVFRKSRNEVTDFQFVQESKLESSELLRDITIPNSTEISYGNFTDSNLSNYWISSSDDHPLSVNVDVLQASIKTDYNSTLGGVQHLITSESFSISKDVEYTLTFKTLISGSLNGSEYLRGYLSSSDGYQQTFLTVSGSDIYKTRQIVSQNIIANPISASNAHLVFEISGSNWYISNVSLKNAQETSFSPDEFLLIQEIPRKLAAETFDFRFEFYDINNNYIPVDVLASATFGGGNDFPTSGKLLTFESDRNAFRFSTGSIQNPENQVVKFTLTQNNLVGTPTFASAAYDVDGNYLNPSNYSQYPGFLTSVTPAGGLLTINNFTGSYIGTPPTPYVGSIVYTASLDGLEEYETVYRLEDGENAPTLIVTSDANQFIYEPTTLSPKPSEQNITIRAQRKNLESYNTLITVNSSSNAPLTEGLTTANGVTTYTISATDFSSSFSSSSFDSVTYSFTGSDVYGNDYSDEVTISKVVNFDGVSLVLSNESTTFPAKSTGEVVGGFAASSGSVQMFIGGNQIQHIDGLTGQKNAFDIISASGDNVTPTDDTPNTSNYSISSMTADSGSLTLDIRYIAGDGITSQSFQKVVSYTKAKKAVPTVLTKTSPTTQTINSSSLGFETPQVVEVVLQEGGDEYIYDGSLGSPQTFKINGLGYSAGSASFSNEIITLFPSSSSGGIITSGIIGSASVSYIDSEETLVQNKLVRFDLSVSKIGVDGENGSNGIDAKVVSLSANQYTIPYDGDGNESGTNIITLTATTNITGSVYYEFQGSNDGGSTWTYRPQNTTSNTYTLTNAQEPGVGEGWLWQVDVRAANNSGSILAFDNIDVFGLKEGSDAFTVFLTNEAHTFTATSESVVLPADIANGFTEVRFFRGTDQYTYNQTGGVGSNTYKTGSVSLTNITVSGSISSGQLKITPLTLTADQGSYTIPLIDNNTGTTLNKTYTFSKSKAGNIGADGINGSAGSDAKTVALTADQYIVQYNGDGVKTAVSITLTASQQNHQGTVYYEFLKNGVSKQNTTSNVYSILDADEAAVNTTDLWEVRTRENSNSSIVIAFDNTDIFGVQDGTNAITAFLTNEAHTLPTTNTGIVTYTGSGTSVVVYKGSTELNGITSGTPTLGQFTVTTAVTTGTITVGTKTSSGNPMVFADHSGMTTDLAIIEYTINVENLVTLKKYQTLAKSKQGVDGVNGSAGTNAKTVTLTASQYRVEYDGDGNKTAVAIVLTATPQNFVDPYYQFTENGVERRVYSTTPTYTIPDGEEPAVGVVDLWQVNVKEGNVGSVVAFDNIDVFGLKEGSDAFTVFLTNEAHTFPGDTSGLPTTYAGGATEVRMFRGTQQYTYDGTAPYDANSYRIGTVTATGITMTQSTVSSQRVFTPSAATATNGTVVIPVIDNATGTTFNKTYTFSVSTKGTDGADGAQGPQGPQGPDGQDGQDGRRTATGLVYYQLSSATAPATPTATSFAFNTANFTGLTTNWSKGAPTFAAGNSNKYWYSTYTAVETTAGGGTATPTFTASTQAIGFTGLVTFTSANNITDGTNTSNIVEPGSVTNHIGGANVTTINGGKISTGTITSTGYSLPSPDTGGYTLGGTIFNLDNGALRSKNFYIDSSGNAAFKGNLTGASGTFSDTVSGATITGGTIRIGSGTSVFSADSNGLYLGNTTFASAPFRVTPAGALTATNANITGTISATAGSIGGWTINSTRLFNSGVALSTNDGGNRGLFIDNASGGEAVAVHDGTSFRNSTSTSAFTAWSDPGNSQAIAGPIFGQNTPSSAGYAFYSAFTSNVAVSDGGMIGITSGEIDILVSQNPTTYWLDRGTANFIQTYHWLYIQVYNSANTFIGERLIASGYVNYNGSYSKQISNLGAASIVLSSGTYKARIKHLIGVNFLASGDSSTLHDAYYSGVNAVYATSGAGRSVEMNQIGMKATYGLNSFIVNTTLGDNDLLSVGGSSVFTGPATFTGIDASVIDVDSLTVGEISLRGGVLTVNGDIRATGDMYALATSDRRLKTNIIPISNSIDIIKKLNGYTFNWNSESKKSQDKQEIGIIAQEVQEVLPQLVGDKGMGYLGVEYDKIVAVLIEGIKEQQLQIENLENKIEELKKFIK